MKKLLLLSTFLSCFTGIGQTSDSIESTKPLFVFVGGFGQTKSSAKRMLKRLEATYPKLSAYDVLVFSHTNSVAKMKRKIVRRSPNSITLACFSMGANKGLLLANELDVTMQFAFIDPWFINSKWQGEDSLANQEFKDCIAKLPENSMIVYGSDFVMKNNQDISKISGPFGTKNCKDCYAHLRRVWGEEGKIFRSNAGHKYFPELYVKQFLPEIKVENSSSAQDNIGI